MRLVTTEGINTVVIAIGISDGICGCSQFTCSVGVLIPEQDIACVIVFPGVGKLICLVILPDQLILAVINIACGICAVADRENIARG